MLAAMAPAQPLIMFAHGAGAPSSSRWMQAWADRLGRLGRVVAFDYPYMKAGRKTPDKLPALIEAHRQALNEARAGADVPVVLAGKSMGSRVGCHLANVLAAEGAPPAALVCFGYPLRAMGSGALRDEVLRALTTPILFLSGSRDPLCPLEDLAKVRQVMTAPSELFVVEGGDHSLEVRKRAAAAAGKSQADWDAALLGAITNFFAARGLGHAER
jgi:predicted alpha/beta-hydrolase family hydrolase